MVNYPLNSPLPEPNFGVGCEVVSFNFSKVKRSKIFFSSQLKNISLFSLLSSHLKNISGETTELKEVTSANSNASRVNGWYPTPPGWIASCSSTRFLKSNYWDISVLGTLGTLGTRRLEACNDVSMRFFKPSESQSWTPSASRPEVGSSFSGVDQISSGLGSGVGFGVPRPTPLGSGSRPSA